VEELMNTFGRTIKDARLTAGLTQDDLAEQAGVTTRYIMAIENENKQPSMKVLFKLIRGLKISADTIFFPKFNMRTKKRTPHSYDRPV
jgi:DNA-binding XRE family transcriptional regulator